MLGISEEKLRAMHAGIKERTRINYVISDFHYGKLSALSDAIGECKELQEPWIPIDENTPRDREIKIYDSGYGQVVVKWNEFYKCFTDPHGHKYLSPTHWQELPNPPEIMPIHKPESPR